MRLFLVAPAGLALAAALASGPAHPAKAGIPYAERSSAQRAFVDEYLKAHPDAAPLATPADLDRFLAEFQAAWAKSLGGSPPGSPPDPILARLDPGIPLWAMLKRTAMKPPDWAHCYVWSHHALPAFYADLETLKENPSVERSTLLYPVNLVHVLGFPVFVCDLPLAEWDRFRVAMDELPRVLDLYVERKLYVGDTGKEVRRFRDHARDIQPALAARDALYRDDLARARQELVRGFDEGGSRLHVAMVGQKVADLLVARGQVDEAFSVLDLVTRSTGESDLPADMLRDWYVKADAQRGPERLARAATERLTALVRTDEQVQLSGQYVDLLTGKPLDLASLAGKTVLIDFWATWCTICLAEVPRLNALAESQGGNLVVVSVSSDAMTGRKLAEPAVLEVARAKGMRYPVLYDRPQGLTERFQVEAWPTHVLIGSDGKALAPPGTKKRRPQLDEIEAYFAARRQASLPASPPAGRPPR